MPSTRAVYACAKLLDRQRTRLRVPVIGQAQFTAPGQLRFYQANGDTYVDGNTSDTLPCAELLIILDTPTAMRGGDFLL